MARGLSVITLEVKIPLTTDRLDDKKYNSFVKTAEKRIKKVVFEELRQNNVNYRAIKQFNSVEEVSIKESNELSLD